MDTEPEEDEEVVDRYSRQKDLVPSERLEGRKVLIIGVGATGRQIALQLAAMGIEHIQLVDHDTVEESNIASQGYWEEDLGKNKVDCTASVCRRINSKMTIECHPNRFDKGMNFGDTVFNCVDSIETRKEIWEDINESLDFYCDGRMADESFRILPVYNEATRKYYPTTLFDKEEAYEGSCTAKTTIFCANIIAGMMISQFVKYLRGVPVEADVYYNLVASEMEVFQE